MLTACSRSRLPGKHISTLDCVQGRTGSLTGRNIEHISIILFWGYCATLLGRDERLEQSDGRAVDISGNEGHPDALALGHILQLYDEIVSFLLKCGLEKSRHDTPPDACLVASSRPVIILRNLMRQVLGATG